MRPVPENPPLPTGLRVDVRRDPQRGFDQILRVLHQVFFEHAFRLNRMAPKDGSEGPIKLATYAVNDLPPAADFPGALVFVPDETDGPTIAFSDGSDWKRVSDGVVVS